jgi:hypothetical protein
LPPLTFATAGRAYHPGVTLTVGRLLGEVSSAGATWFMRRHGEAFEKVDLAEEQAQMIIVRQWPPEFVNEARKMLR